MSVLKIKINAGSTKGTSSARATGSLQHIITDEERATFGILDDDLKRKAGAYMGREPSDVFVRSPTPWGDMYHLYGWDQVQTVLTPIETEILSVETVPTITSKMEFKNESSKKGTFTGKLSKMASTTVETSWSQSYNLSFNQEIRYAVVFPGTGNDGSTSLWFQAQCGKNIRESRTTIIGTEAGMPISVELEPSEEVVAELSANSRKMMVRITYEAYLTGLTAINYNSGFEGRRYHGIPIEMILCALNSIKVTEDIEIGFYDEVRVVIKNLAGDTLRCERVPCFL